MNIRNYFLGACAAVAFTACAGSDDIAAVEQPVWDEYGNGYLSFSVQLPTDNSSRGENDQFDKGSAFEYKVNNVALLLFKGSTEDGATYQQFVDMKNIDFGDPAAGNITLDKKYVAKITGMDLAQGEKVWALAVINRNHVFDHTSSTIGGVDMRGKSFAQVKDIIVNTNLNANGNGTGADAALQSPTGGILMLNAPLANKQGTTATKPDSPTYTILQDVTSSIFESENKAREGACSNIYVERAVAKVTVVYDAKSGTAVDKTDKALFSWDMQNWWLDNTNTKSYVVRNMANFHGVSSFYGKAVPASWDNISHSTDVKAHVYRMIGKESVYHNAAISAGDKDLTDRYRTYFAVDPNYNQHGIFNEYGSVSSFGSENPMYCAENVFDVDHQVWGETTRVLVGVKLTAAEGDSYFAHPGDEKFLSKNAVKELAYNAAIDNYRKAISNFRDHNLVSGSITSTSTGVSMTITEGADEVVVTLPTSNITVSATDAQVAAANIGYTTAGELETALININKEYASQNISHKSMGVRYYHSGMSYYQVRIKHFGDEHTPWLNGENVGGAGTPGPGGVTAAYPTGDHRDCNYLGRYGVLRNNWYEIRLANVIKIGYPLLKDLDLTVDPEDPNGPEDPIDPDTPDDHIDKEQWINAEVNILSWAKRLQNNILGND